MNTKQVDVAVVGSANADLVVEVPRRPGGGETLLGGDLQLLAGGKGANQATASARCGARTAMVACLGNDANGAFLRTQLSAAGVETASVRTADRPTGTAIIYLTPDGENSIVVSPGANAALDIPAVDRSSEVWLGARVVALSLEIPLETAKSVALRAHAAGSRIVLNAAPSADLDPETLAVCDPLAVNEHEALDILSGRNGERLAGAEASAAGTDATASAEQLAHGLRAAGARSVVVTLGDEGAIVADVDGCTHIPAYTVDVVDTTGAGDAFVGAVACELAREVQLVEAVRFATAVSAVSVQRLGAQASYEERTVVEAFIRSRSAR